MNASKIDKMLICIWKTVALYRFAMLTERKVEKPYTLSNFCDQSKFLHSTDK